MERLIDAYTDGVLERDEFDPRLNRARERVSQLGKQLAEHNNESREQATLREALACLDDFTSSIGSHLDSADWATRREILRTLIDRIEIEEEQVRIVYRVNFPLFAKKASGAGNEKVLHFCWRGETGSLRNSFLGGLTSALDHHARFKKSSNQCEQFWIADAYPQQFFQTLLTHIIKEAFDVRVTDPIHFPRRNGPSQNR